MAGVEAYGCTHIAETTSNISRHVHPLAVVEHSKLINVMYYYYYGTIAVLTNLKCRFGNRLTLVQSTALYLRYSFKHQSLSVRISFFTAYNNINTSMSIKTMYLVLLEAVLVLALKLKEVLIYCNRCVNAFQLLIKTNDNVSGLINSTFKASGGQYF